MKTAILLAFTFSSILFSCNSDSTTTTTEKESYEKTKASMRAKEERNPQNFLTANSHDKKNLFGQTVIKGTLTNKASVAIFKDVNLKLSFYSKTKALLETDNETVFEILHPGESKNFKTKYFAPKGTDSVAIAVLTAKTISE